jgi:hypothetical protein
MGYELGAADKVISGNVVIYIFQECNETCEVQKLHSIVLLHSLCRKLKRTYGNYLIKASVVCVEPKAKAKTLKFSNKRNSLFHTGLKVHHFTS